MCATQEIEPVGLATMVGLPSAPQVVDVRRRPAFDSGDRIVAGAVWRPHAEADVWGLSLPPGPIVVYCVHGHQVSRAAAVLLRSVGRDARVLDGGIEAYLAAGGAAPRKVALPPGALADGARWLCAAPLGPDGLACIWLIRRFVDRRATVLATAPDWGQSVAAEVDAVVTAVTENGAPRAFSATLERFGLRTAALGALDAALAGGSVADAVADIVEGLARVHGAGTALIEPCLPLFDGLHARYAASGGAVP